MGGQDGVVGFNNSGGNLGSRVDGEFQLGLLAVVDRETFHQKRGESGSSAATEGVEQEEALKARTLISQFTNPIQDQIDNFFSDGVVSSSIVVGSIFLASDELFRVEELTVGASSDFIDDGGFQINKDSTGNMFARSGFSEKGGERVITSHQFGCHVPSSRAPSMHCQFGNQLDQYGLRYIHA